MPERTGNVINDPDSVWDAQGRRKLDGNGDPVVGTPAPKSAHNVREDSTFKGKRPKRRYGAHFYENAPEPDQTEQDREKMSKDAALSEDELKALIGELGAAVKAKGDGEALTRLTKIASEEYARDGGPRSTIRAALSRVRIGRPRHEPVHVRGEDGPGVEDTDEE